MNHLQPAASHDLRPGRSLAITPAAYPTRFCLGKINYVLNISTKTIAAAELTLILINFFSGLWKTFAKKVAAAKKCHRNLMKIKAGTLQKHRKSVFRNLRDNCTKIKA